jgi:hypothetical protein
MFSIEEIEQIMEDSAEAIAKQKEIDDLLSGSFCSCCETFEYNY